MKRTCLVVALTLWAPLCIAQDKKKEDTWVALKGGDIYTVTEGVVRGGTILLKNNKIAEIGHDLELPDGTTLYEVSGFRIYPGLVALNASNLVGSRGKIVDTADPFHYYMTLALSGGITTAKQGRSVVKLVRGELEGMVLRENVGIDLARTNSFSPSFQGRQKLRAALRKAKKYIGEFDKWAERQAKKSDSKDKAPSKSGVNTDLVKLLRHRESGWVGASNRRMIADLANLAIDFDFDLVITGGVEAWTEADLLGRAGATVIVTPRTRRDPDETRNAPTGSRIENAAILHDSGVKVGIQTLGSGISLGGIVGRDLLNLPMEAAFAIRGGLPQQTALEALTIGAAQIIGVSDQVGSLEPGKDADLIVTDGDVLDYRSFVHYAFVNGKLRYDKSKETYFAHIRPRKMAEPIVVGAKKEKKPEPEAKPEKDKKEKPAEKKADK